MRRRVVKNASSRILAHAGLVILNPFEHRGHWRDVFKNDSPIHIEIGMGKGAFILQMALKNPNINYVGIEKFDSVIIMAIEKIANYQLKNLLLIRADALLLDTIFATNEVERIYLNFSDPWPKNRHEKRRLTSSLFLKRYEKVLTPKGVIEFKTDNSTLFEYSIISMTKELWIIDEFSVNLHRNNEEIVKTEYEEKFTSLGYPIYYVKVRKDDYR